MSPSSTNGCVVDVTTLPTTTAADRRTANGTASACSRPRKFGTEMQYQHLVFEEFARKVQPNIDVFVVPDGYETTINPASSPSSPTWSTASATRC